MAGHSKWKNIQHTKSRVDAKRGKIFTKIIRELTVAAREGGGDVNSNPRLRTAVEEARSQNMPKDTIERAIKRGSGGLDDSNLQPVRYEGYGAGGVAVLVDCLTDNKNRTVSEVRHAFTKCGGNLGTDGSVAYLFSAQGQLLFDSSCDEQVIMEQALVSGAEDVASTEDNHILVTTAYENYLQVKEAMQEAKLLPKHAELTMTASTQIPVLDLETAEKVVRLIDMLEDLDDVQKVYTNAEISDDIADQL